MSCTAKQDRRYELTVYDGDDATTTQVAPVDLKTFDPQGVDFYMSPAGGILGFRDAAGKWVEYRNKWPRLGPVCIAIIQAVQWNFGDYLSPAAIAELTGYASLRENTVLAARVHAIRKALRDPGSRFIETRTSGGYAIRWPKKRTWATVERLPGRASA